MLKSNNNKWVKKNTLELKIGTRVRRWFVLLHNFIMLSSFYYNSPVGVWKCGIERRKKYMVHMVQAILLLLSKWTTPLILPPWSCVQNLRVTSGSNCGTCAWSSKGEHMRTPESRPYKNTQVPCQTMSLVYTYGVKK